MRKKVAVVTGIGPGLGAAVAKRFAREGYAVAGLARNTETYRDIQSSIQAEGGSLELINTDATDETSVASAMEQIRSNLGEPEIYVYNAGAFHFAPILDITPQQFAQHWMVNCHGAFIGAREVLPKMIETGKGTIILTSATAAHRGGANFSCLAVGKFGLRALAQSMAREYGPSGVHVASVVVDGLIDTPRIRDMFGTEGPRLKADAIAETYWQLHKQDPSAWTLEMDIRPSNEKF